MWHEDNTLVFIAQGSEKKFGLPYAYGHNDSAKRADIYMCYPTRRKPFDFFNCGYGPKIRSRALERKDAQTF